MSGIHPEPEPGDRWNWGLLCAAWLAVVAVLHMRAMRPFVLIAEAVVGFVGLVIVLAGLTRLLR